MLIQTLLLVEIAFLVALRIFINFALSNWQRPQYWKGANIPDFVKNYIWINQKRMNHEISA